MARYLKLQVPSACKESWNNMRPDQSGRYCISCQKSVVDFTQMTDQELVTYFKSNQGSTCGRFTEDQLNKDIRYPGKSLPWIKYFFKFSLPAFLLSLKATAGTARLPTPTAIAPVKYKAAIGDTVKDTIPVSGFVYDNTGSPLPGATVMLKGTNRGVMTNADGAFTFKQIDLPVILEISFVGFVSSEVHLTSPRELANIKLQLTPALSGEVVIVGGARPGKSIRKADKLNKVSKTEKQIPVARPANMLAYPNPVMAGGSLKLQCRSFENGNYLAELYTVSGQLVKTTKLNYDKKNAQINLSIDEMFSGTFFLQLTHESGKQYSEHVVIR